MLAAALAPLLIGSWAQSDSAPTALTTSTTAMMVSDGKSAEAAWPALTDPGWPPPDFTDPLERPRTPATQPLEVPATPSPAFATEAGAASPATSPPGVDRQQSVARAVQQTVRGTQTEYTWEDGDRTLTVTLQTDLTIVEHTAEELKDALKNALAATPRGNVVRSTNPQARSTRLPVFTSPSGDLMTLPGGVLLLLDQDWGETEVNRFFADNALSTSDVSALGWIDNGYFIETAPGFPSLTLANTLAGQEGVEISSPNWWQQVELK